MFNELISFEVSGNLFLNKIIRNYFAPNFKAMINELREYHDMTFEKIAFLLPVSGASTIKEWVLGAKLNYANGEALIDLWKYLTEKSDADIPRIDHYLIA
ncbi:hypothetical protein P7L54_04980 [Acinetobacter bereziniae]|uniref:hypothetical protein n=1 Tax=Acinetobacter bereziniae TaxID=106648 RepID=UPI001905408A|nr:hypothetical protein [Acinetobacter bereziniae]MDG3555303.1 hypothetical protein [Acinetobacter bereziniae]QQC81433.1 hypothetical protein I9192_04865 [Acinetobacter bereziniae]UUN94543.1 hypothetical protein I9189_004885 [Acinetobacter bereziniae]WMW75607.1 hypothetical protein RG306_04850 [Acinetobacter bereziniae]